jgi:alginate O-acetyltransferase complex protein AlgI
MPFHSITFIIFATTVAVAVAILFLLAWERLRMAQNTRLILLSAASLLFYFMSGWQYPLILLGVSVIAHLAALGIDMSPAPGKEKIILTVRGQHPERRKRILWGGVGLVMAILLVFKYTGFFLENMAAVQRWLGLDASGTEQLSLLSVLAPVGVSFYTFQAISYIVDVYMGRLKASRNFRLTLAYFSLFPKLLAGPIERGKELMPQLMEYRKASSEDRWQGLKLIAFGYFQKLVIADNLAPMINQVFGSAAEYSGFLIWALVISGYAFQIFFDFAGYSNIAVGVGRWMGIHLTQNFRHPYIARSVGDFWNRWHISLSTWLRDYVFYPISRSKLGRGRQHLVMWFTMLVSGFWHGAGWTFILWGGLHGLYITVERITRWPERLSTTRFGRYLTTLLVFIEVCFAWIFFRSPSIATAGQVLRGLFGPFSGTLDLKIGVGFWVAYLTALFLELWALFEFSERIQLTEGQKRLLEIPAIVFMLVAAVFLRRAGGTFVYMGF